jgi:hypothetical protein
VTERPREFATRLMDVQQARTLQPHTPPKSPSTWTINQEVIENEPALAPLKRPAAFAASKLLVRQSLIRFDAHQLVLRAAVRAVERRCFGNWHGVVTCEA